MLEKITRLKNTHARAHTTARFKERDRMVPSQKPKTILMMAFGFLKLPP